MAHGLESNISKCCVFNYALEQTSDDTLSEKNWIISVTAGKK